MHINKMEWWSSCDGFEHAAGDRPAGPLEQRCTRTALLLDGREMEDFRGHRERSLGSANRKDS